MTAAATRYWWLWLIAAPAFLGRILPGVFTDYRGLVLGFGIIYGVAALSLNILTGYAGQISFGHAAFMGIGAFCASIVTYQLRMPMLVGVLFSVIVSAICALIVGLPSLRLGGLNLAIATLAFGVAMQQSVFQFPALTSGAAGAPVPRPKIGDHEMTMNFDFLSLLVAAGLLVWMFDRNITRSRLGRGLVAQRSSERYATSVGVPVAGYRLQAFVLSGAIAGLGGNLFGHMVGFVQRENFGFDLSLSLLILVMLGGIGSRTGVFIAASMFAILPRLIQPLEEYALLVAAAGLIGAVIFHPQGFGSIPGSISARRSRKDAAPDPSRSVTVPELPLLIEKQHVVSEDALLRVDDVSVTYGDFLALNRATLEVSPGTIVGIVGPNGAGKTTLFDCISGFVRPTAGRITLNGTDLKHMAPTARLGSGIARTFQSGGSVAEASVLDNMLLARHPVFNYGSAAALLMTPTARAAEHRERHSALEALASIGLADSSDQLVGTLSGGQRRMLEIACCLRSGAQLVLMDEPTAGLSPPVIADLVTRLKEVAESCGVALLVIEHNLQVVTELCQEVHGLVDGSIVVSGAPEAVFRHPIVRDAFLGTAA